MSLRRRLWMTVACRFRHVPPPGRIHLPTGSNLQVMPRYTIQQKLDVVAQWEASGLPQDAFVRDHPVRISSRTLRDWVALARRPEKALARQRAVVAHALDEWKAIHAAMAQERGPASRPVAVVVESTYPTAMDAPHDHETPEPAAAPPVPPARLPMPLPNWRPW